MMPFDFSAGGQLDAARILRVQVHRPVDAVMLIAPSAFRPTFSQLKRYQMMSSKNPLLSLALVVFGAAFLLIVPLSIVWPSGWAWNSGGPMASDYFLMIAAVYFTLGIFMIRAAKDPAANASLIWFVVWSSLAHSAVMAWESFRTPMEMGHLVGDVPALLIIAAVLGGLMKVSSVRPLAV